MFLFSELLFKKYLNFFFCFVLLNSIIDHRFFQKESVQEKIISKNWRENQAQYPKYINKKYVLGKFDYRKDSGFVKVDPKYSSKDIYIRKETYKAFLKMQEKAAEQDIHFVIISGTRDFEHQKRIWEYKWNEKYKLLAPLQRAQKILEYSSMPSTSRHHWGTDIDLNSLSNSYFSSGKGKDIYNWLKKNAHKFGFYQAYTSKDNGRKGYNEEKWHWSYAPLASIYLKFYNQNISHQDISGFAGYEFSKELNIIENYVNGINPKL